MALSGISREAEGFPLSLKDPFISPLDVGDAEDVDPLASCTRPRGLGDRDFDFLLKSGRSVVFPVYKGTYERGGGINSDYPNISANFRDHMVMIAKDLGRAIDYVSSRPDIAADRIGYCVFGKVVKGLDVVDRISRVKTKAVGEHSDVPAEDVVIKTARRVRR